VRQLIPETIALDVDNVLADTAGAFCKRASIIWEREVKKEQIRHPKIVGSFRADPKHVLELLESVWQEWKLLPLLEAGAPKLIRDLRRNGHKLVIATARPIRSIPDVRSWLQANAIEYDELAQFENRTKSSVSADILVDDDQSTVVDFVLQSTTKHIGLLYDQPWNREVLTFDGVNRIKSLSELRSYN
jgi:5'(3')-deoxyribonucleotidase